jgi:hypothetical protein
VTLSLCSTTPVLAANDGPPACENCKSWCPDDYCRKPLPNCPPTPCFGLTDDYCPKPLPKCPCVPAYLGCDDYCCKPLPKCSSLCFPLWYTCGSSAAGSATTQPLTKQK